jgi:cyclophilin family peptidyl-prolyl cis-trans isomerase
MIQGGDFTRRDGTGGHSSKGPGTTIDDQYDARLSHLRGALAWAKTAAPQSIGSQFYIVHNASGTPFLDHQPGGGPNQGYSVFGQLYEGFDVLDAIARKPTASNDRPLDEVVIESVVIQIH